MKLSAVVLARVLAYVESFDLVSRGQIFFPDLIQELVQRYKFQKFPRSFEEFDDEKGVEFQGGTAGGKVIQKFTIFNTLLAMETRSNTKDSEQILEDMLTWGHEKFGLDYKPGMIKRFAYISDVTFYSDVPLLSVSPLLTQLAAKTGDALSKIWQEPVTYQPIVLSVGHDPTTRKYPIAPFQIQRRAEARFSDNKYFSEAPLPTDTHIAFLEEFEAEVKKLHT